MKLTLTIATLAALVWCGDHATPTIAATLAGLILVAIGTAIAVTTLRS